MRSGSPVSSPSDWQIPCPRIFYPSGRAERGAWLEHHPKPWLPETEAAYHKRFSTRIDQALDAGHGSSLLRAKEVAAFVSDTLTRCDAVDYLLHSWVIMPNHVHVLVSPFPGEPLAGMVAGWKRFSATRIHKASGATGTLWQKDYFDRLIRDWDHFANVAQIHPPEPREGRPGGRELPAPRG